MKYHIIQGDVLDGLRAMADESVNCCVTSPPYWGLRDYGHDGQIGLEETPEAYISKMVEVFREVKRVLRGDGTLWLNLGDSYAGPGCGPAGSSATVGATLSGCQSVGRFDKTVVGLKPKDLVGIPWRVAFALQADGWYLRQDIIWSKPNPMPESVTDRCTKAHEYVFLLSKSSRYWYDADAVKEEDAGRAAGNVNGFKNRQGTASFHVVSGGEGSDGWEPGTGRNRRSVWHIATQPFPGAHFAVMPQKLVEPCILAGCPEGGLVLDPFTGSGTVGIVACRLGRRFVGCELNPEYVAMAEKRLFEATRQLNLFEVNS
jgi:DNA modification methylase